MENLTKYTSTELLKLINDAKSKHDLLKQEIIDDTYEIDELEKNINDRLDIINNKINIISDLEKNYVSLIEEISKR